MKLNIFARKVSIRGSRRAAPRRPNGFVNRRGGKLVDCNGKAIVLKESREVEVIAERMRAELRAMEALAKKIINMPVTVKPEQRARVAVVKTLKDKRPNVGGGFTG